MYVTLKKIQIFIKNSVIFIPNYFELSWLNDKNYKQNMSYMCILYIYNIYDNSPI